MLDWLVDLVVVLLYVGLTTRVVGAEQWAAVHFVVEQWAHWGEWLTEPQCVTHFEVEQWALVREEKKKMRREG